MKGDESNQRGKARVVPLRVAYLSDAVGLGGGETSLLYHLEACLTLGGIEPLLVCPPGELAEAAIRLGVKTKRVGIGAITQSASGLARTFLPATFRLWSVLNRERIQVAHAESLVAVCHLLPKLISGQYPVFMTYHGYGELRRVILAKVVRRRLRNVFAVSKTAMDGAQRLVDKKRVVKLPLALSPSFMTGKVRPREDLLRELHIPGNRKIILQLARFQEIKGQHNLLAAYIRARESGLLTETALLFVGGVIPGSDRDAQEYYDGVVGAATSCRFKDDIHFSPFRQDSASVINAASVLVIPSRYESFGMVAIEAMAIGTPVIATNSGGPSEIITNGKDGLLYTQTDTEHLIALIVRVLISERLSADLRRRSRLTVEERYTPQARVSTLIDYYKQSM